MQHPDKGPIRARLDGAPLRSPQSPQSSQSLSLWRLLHLTPARAALAAALLLAASLLLAKRHDTPDKLVPRPPAAGSRAPSASAASSPFSSSRR